MLSLRVLVLSLPRAAAFLQAKRCFPKREIISTVKPYVINRKNFLFSDTEKGADASAAVMSIIETAKRNNLDVYGYLLYLLTVLPEMGTDPTEDQIKSVMPWSFALPAYCRQTYSEIQ